MGKFGKNVRKGIASGFMILLEIFVILLTNFLIISTIILFSAATLPVGASISPIMYTWTTTTTASFNTVNELFIRPFNQILTCLTPLFEYRNQVISFHQAILADIAEEFGFSILQNSRSTEPRDIIDDFCGALEFVFRFLNSAAHLLADFGILSIDILLIPISPNNPIQNLNLLDVIAAILNSGFASKFDPLGCFTPFSEARQRFIRCICRFAYPTVASVPPNPANAIAGCFCPGFNLFGNVITDMLIPCLRIDIIQELVNVAIIIENGIRKSLDELGTAITAVGKIAAKIEELKSAADYLLGILEKLFDPFCDFFGCRPLPNGEVELYDKITGRHITTYNPSLYRNIEEHRLCSVFECFLHSNLSITIYNRENNAYIHTLGLEVEKKEIVENTTITDHIVDEMRRYRETLNTAEIPEIREVADITFHSSETSSRVNQFVANIDVMAQYTNRGIGSPESSSYLKKAIYDYVKFSANRSATYADKPDIYHAYIGLYGMYKILFDNLREPFIPHTEFSRMIKEANINTIKVATHTIRSVYGDTPFPSAASCRRERVSVPMPAPPDIVPRVVPLVITFSLVVLPVGTGCIAALCGIATVSIPVIVGLFAAFLAAAFIPLLFIVSQAIFDGFVTLITGEQYGQDYVSDWISFIDPYIHDIFYFGFQNFDFPDFFTNFGDLLFKQLNTVTVTAARPIICQTGLGGPFAKCPPKPQHFDNLPDYTSGLIHCVQDYPCELVGDCKGRAIECRCGNRIAYNFSPCNGTTPGKCLCFPYIIPDQTIAELQVELDLVPRCEDLGWRYLQVMPFQHIDWNDMMGNWMVGMLRNIRLVTNLFSKGVFISWLGLFGFAANLIPIMGILGRRTTIATIVCNYLSLITVYSADMLDHIFNLWFIRWIPYAQEYELKATHFPNADEVGGRGSATMSEYMCAAFTIPQDLLGFVIIYILFLIAAVLYTAGFFGLVWSLVVDFVLDPLWYILRLPYRCCRSALGVSSSEY
jgi:hypothetical protein